MKRKGFTLVELLVVIAIIALLMGILMPALAQVRRLANRMICGTNLRGIGTAMVTYANDNDEEFPRAGGRNAKWETSGSIAKWDVDPANTSNNTPEKDAFGASNPTATMTSNFFLLIKYVDCTPKQFVCKGDGAKKFSLNEVVGNSTADVDDMTDAWDFGGDSTETESMPGEYVSYSYQMPFSNTGGGSAGGMGVNASSNPGSPVCADRNPFLDKNALNVYVDQNGGAVDSEEEDPKWQDNDVYDPDKVWNSAAHSREGQNVVYVDSHVTFEKKCNIGIENDNIWKRWTSADYATDKEDKQWGAGLGDGTPRRPLTTAQVPWAQQDAFLVNEYNGD